MYVNTGTLWMVVHESELSDRIDQLEKDNKFGQGAGAAMAKGVGNALGSVGISGLSTDLNNFGYELRNKMADATHESRKKIGEELHKAGKLGFFERLWEFIKRCTFKGRDVIAKVLDKLRTWAENIAHKEYALPKNERGWISKIKATLAKMIEYLSRKLHNLFQKYRGDIGSPKYVQNKDNDRLDAVKRELDRETKKERDEVNERLGKFGYSLEDDNTVKRIDPEEAIRQTGNHTFRKNGKEHKVDFDNQEEFDKFMSDKNQDVTLVL